MTPDRDGNTDIYHQQGFFQAFQSFIKDFDDRLRKVEQENSSTEARFTSLKEDRCDPRSKDIKELFDSRNDYGNRLEVIESVLESISARAADSVSMRVAVVAAVLGGLISGILALAASAYF